MAASIIDERLRQHARHRPRDAAIKTLGETWSWAELADRAAAVRKQLEALQIDEGSVVAIALPDSPALVAAIAAVAMAGCVPGMVDLQDATNVDATVRDLRPAALIEAAGTQAKEARSDGGQLPGGACILFTSGTTAKPKGIVWSEKRLRALLELFPTPPDDGGEPCVGVLRPMARAAGFFPSVRALYWGVPLAIIDSPFAMAPAFRAIDQLGVTRLSITPAHVDLLLRAAPPVPPRLASVNVSGAPIAAETLLALADFLAGVKLSTSYGLAELGTVTLLMPDELRDRPQTCGRVLAGRRLSVVGVSDERLPPGSAGGIVVELDDWTEKDGYWRCDPSIAERFANGVLQTNDRGFLDAEGYLVLTERAAEVIKVAGRSVSAPSIEATLRLADVSRSLIVVGVPHPRYGEVPAVVFEAGGDPGLTQSLQQEARRRLRGHELPRWFLPVRALPRTTTGKIERKIVEGQARAWVALWPDTLPWAGRIWPARALAGSLRGETIAVDGVADDWKLAFDSFDFGARDPAERDLTLVRQNAPRKIEALACARVRDGVDAASTGVRVVVGPQVSAAVRDADIETIWLQQQLLACAAALPGPDPVATVVRLDARCSELLAARLGFEKTSRTNIWVRRTKLADARVDDRILHVVKVLP